MRSAPPSPPPSSAEVSPSTLYATACVLEGVPFINGSPQNTFVPGLIDLAVQHNVLIGACVPAGRGGRGCLDAPAGGPCLLLLSTQLSHGPAHTCCAQPVHWGLALACPPSAFSHPSRITCPLHLTPPHPSPSPPPPGGDDFKSGQTKMKSVLVDFLVGAGIKPTSIVSYNHLGNNDGMNLSAPQVGGPGG